MLTMEQIAKILRDGFATTLREWASRGAAGATGGLCFNPAPYSAIDKLAEDAANNLAMVIAHELGEHLDTAHHDHLQLESLWNRLYQAGGRGETLDAMLTAVLEDARAAYRSRGDLAYLRAALDRFNLTELTQLRDTYRTNGMMPKGIAQRLERLEAAASELLECFDEGDVDAFHPDTEDPDLTRKHGSPTTIECPEDDTCECRGPAAINELARARDDARKALRDLTH